MQVRAARFATLLLLVVGASLAGCGGGGGGGGSPESHLPPASPGPDTAPSTLVPEPSSPPSPDPDPSVDAPGPISDPQPEPGTEPGPAPWPAPPTGNRAPRISGVAAGTASVGLPYSFVPQASDADGDRLTFRVELLPPWASFDPASGRLSGTPTGDHVGGYSNIRITVSDGNASAALPSFSILVTQPEPGSAELVWTPPTDNTDGTALTDLAGYRIVYGRSASVLHQTVQVSSAGLDRYLIEGLAPGTWYFAIKAYTSAGVESGLSNVVSKVVY